MNFDPAFEADVEKAIASVENAPTLPNQQQVLFVLQKALKQHQRLPNTPLNQSSALLHRDEVYLSLVKSARMLAENPSPVPSAQPLRAMDIVGTDQYEELDAGWIASLWHFLTRGSVPFPDHVSKKMAASDLVQTIGDNVTIAMAGDWGTGDDSSKQIASKIAAVRPDHTVHLGDVYYSGTEDEERKNLVSLWPGGSSKQMPAFALNSNHEMYSGGHGYFGVALPSDLFKAQQGLSYFALQNKSVAIIALDSAYHSARSNLYQQGMLDERIQLPWLRKVASDARAQGKKILLMTHHNGMALDGTKAQPFWDQVTQAVPGGPDVWYWGHEHGAAAFKPVKSGKMSVSCRCVGHGGVPYLPIQGSESLAWAENELANDPKEKRRALNGFLLLKISPGKVVDTFVDELGRERWTTNL